MMTCFDLLGFTELCCWCCCNSLSPKIDPKSVAVGAVGGYAVSKSLHKKASTVQPSTIIIHNPLPMEPQVASSSSSTSTWEKFKTSGITFNVRSPITIVKEQKTSQSMPENNRWSKVIAEKSVFSTEEHLPQEYNIELSGHHDNTNPFD